jgi:uncharacterized protein (TIGR02246 family)
MEARVQGTDELLGHVMGRWKAGIDAGEPERVAEVFTDDVIFQGLHSYSVGRRGVADYYASQAPGMTVVYSILESRRPADDLVLGYLTAEFSFPDRPTVSVYLGVLARRDDGWRIAFYQASRLD